jgi:hypothetical protein
MMTLFNENARKMSDFRVLTFSRKLFCTFMQFRYFGFPLSDPGQYLKYNLKSYGSTL